MNARPRRWRAKRHRRGPGASLALVVSLVLVGIGLIILGAGEIAADLTTEWHYELLRREACKAERHQNASQADAVFNGDSPFDAWLTVEGTPIDYPVAQATGADPEFYLSHDLWGKKTHVGCPYFDWRCSPGDTHKIIYAHHIGTTQLQFSPIADTWQQERFDQLTSATLATRAGTETYIPFCARVVDKQFEDVQRFSMDQGELREWLGSLVAKASAATPEPDALASKARKALTLVTCASQQGGQRERTLLVFVSLES